MTAFYVGQKVRIISATCSLGKQHVGKEAVVNEIDAESETLKRGKIGVTILGCKPRPHLSDSDWCFSPDQLEPLQPPKSQIEEILAMQELPDCDVADLLRKHERELAHG